MKIILASLFLLVVQVTAQSVDSAIEINRKIEETLFASGSYDSDLSWITERNRPLVIQNLLERYNHPEINSPRYIKEALVRAGHWDTILELIEDIKDPRNNDLDSLIYLNQEIIPYMMPMVYTGSTASPNLPGDDVLKYPVRSYAIRMVLGTIIKCEAFPQKTRKWAESLSRNGVDYKDEEWVALVTSWWEHNKDAILEKRYKDATWLPTYKGVPIDCPPEEMRKKVEYFERKYATRLAKITGKADAPGGLARNSLPSQGGPSEISPDAHPSRFFWTGIGGFLTVICYILWRRFTIKDA